MKAKLILKDGTVFLGKAAGHKKSTSGEIVFATGMTGYDLSLTDPSYSGQILTFTYPLIGNWGIPKESKLESNKIHPIGVVISDLTKVPSHWDMEKTLDEWLSINGVPAIVGVDTRALTQKLRSKGVMSAKIIIGKDIGFEDPNKINLVAQVSPQKVTIWKSPSKNFLKIGLLNCGAKRNIAACLTQRGATVYDLPWNYDPFKNNLNLNGLVISNGPGNPKMAQESVNIIRKSLENKLPTFGICLGNQLLALAAGGDTYKLKFGHRAQNQPTIQSGTKKCYITTQNHGFAVDDKKLPPKYKTWFINANDNTNEGIIHESLPFFSVQFHPESSPGPTDTEWLFDYFVEKVKNQKK